MRSSSLTCSSIGQRDVKLIDALASGHLAYLGERAKQREAAVAQTIAVRAIVHEAHHLIAELAMVQDAFGDHASHVTGPGDQNSLQPEAFAPATLQQLAHAFARRHR